MKINVHCAVSFYTLLTGETNFSEICLLTYFLTYLTTHLLHGTVLLEKVTCFQLAEKFRAFYANRSFITSEFATADGFEVFY